MTAPVHMPHTYTEVPKRRRVTNEQILKAFIKTRHNSFFSSSTLTNGLDLSGVVFLVDKVAEESVKVKQWNIKEVESEKTKVLLNMTR